MQLAQARPLHGIGVLVRPSSAATLMVRTCPPRPTESSHPALFVATISTHIRALSEASDRINLASTTWAAMSASGLRIVITIATPRFPLMVARLRPAYRNSTMRESCGVGRGTQFLLGYAPHPGTLKYPRFVQTA